MGIMKITGLTQQSDAEWDYRNTISRPEVSIYDPARLTFKHYAAQFLALTSLIDQEAVEKVRQAADKLKTPDDQDWTQLDAQAILSAVGAPPLPTHVVITRVPGHALLLVRTADPADPVAREIRHAKSHSTVSALNELRAEGIAIATGTCLDVPVKLVEDERGLVVALFLRRHRKRSLTEVERKGEQAKQGEAKQV